MRRPEDQQGYGSVDHDILGTVATQDLPVLVRALEIALAG